MMPPFGSGGMMLGRLAPPVQPAGEATGYCDLECDGVPPRTVGVFGIGVAVHRHWHHACWSCGVEVISRMSMTYTCVTCDVGAGPDTTSHGDSSFDPEFAASHPSPG